MELDGRQIAGSDEYHRYYGYYDEDRAFIDSVAGTAAPVCGIDEAVETMRLLEFLRARAVI